MNQQSHLQVQRELQQLFRVVQQKGAQALPLILQALHSRPEDPNLLHLAGLASAAGGELEQAAIYYRQSLSSHARQPEVLNNLANVCQKLGLVEDAEHHYQEALSLNQCYFDAWKNLGLLYLSQHRNDDARQALTSALELNPSNPSVLTAMGNVYRDGNCYREAADYYNRALEADPRYVNALYNLALCHKGLEQHQQALTCFNKARDIGPHVAQIDLSQGNVMFELGEISEAERYYKSALEKDPNLVLIHETLSEYYWQLGRHDQIETSYRAALADNPTNIALLESFIHTMVACQRIDTARELISIGLAQSTTPELLYLRAKLHAQDGDYSAARQGFEQSLQQRFSIDSAHDLIKLHILTGEYELASGVIDRALTVDSDQQLTWALQGLCWRLTGDERYHWLIDYDRYVQSYTLPTPPGYASLDDFLQTLKTTLLDMHKTQFAPSQQTLLHGTQTPGRLLHKPLVNIQAFKQALAAIVAEYIESLPDDPTHPLLRRKSTHFEFSGSWSVKLYSGGFHVNHVHPQGWISSACYIAMPDHVEGNNPQAACIKFGESPLNLGSREYVERVIEPAAGQLILFPSYTWHGTYNFDCPSGECRLTAPFDVIPIQAPSNDSQAIR